jgi:hypothetical protein
METPMLLPFHPTFVAKRLNVFEFFINPAYANGHHYLYVAFRKDDDQPTPVVTMVIPCEYYSVLKDSPVDWLEESSEHRRKRYGDELATAFQDRVFGEPFLPTLITERLRVFEFCIKPARLNGPRYLYVAFRKDDNPPTQLARRSFLIRTIS